ncbi:MAG: hypothetical protein K2L02_03220 [Clostridia bacterium]|nr:hypothetical protein [Clostridia bacterium]
MKVKPIGIRKDKSWILPIFIIINFAVIVATIVFWLFYRNEFRYEYILENGVELEATAVDYDYDSEIRIDDDSVGTSGWYYIWECHYNNRVYKGVSGYLSKETVMQSIGKKFTVTVDPNSNWAVNKSKSEIRTNGFHYKEFLTCAIVFTCLSPFAILTFVKFAVYPMFLDSRIDRCGKLPKEGEVINARSFIVSYIKVRYIDDKGETKEKWSYSWFTHRETKFMQEKKTITIIPYKNTYGILEEMQVMK